MKTWRAVLISLLMILILGVFSASAASTNTSAASLPWKTQIMDDDETGVMNLSTAFVGKNQIPMLSYSLVDSPRIYQAHMATDSVEGNCGPGDNWYCTYWQDSDLIDGTVSNMATMQIMDTHLIKWAYRTTDGTIRGATIELMNDMSFVTQSWDDLIQLSKFGGILVGTPSLQIRGGHYEMAVTIRDSGGDFPVYQLVHMHYTGNDIKYSCIDSGSVYECDVIDTSVSYYSMGAPSLQIADNGTTGIAYYKNGELMYAYPHETAFGWPANCGGDMWRCISIYEGAEEGIVGDVAKLALGQTGSEIGIAFTYQDVFLPVTLFHAEYVGSDGNCGWDSRFGGISDYRWNCESVVLFYYLNPTATPSFSIDIDPEGFSVMAYDFAMDDLGNKDLYITYPKERVGVSDPGWIAQRIDGAPVYSVNTGSQAALALSNEGLGFISYLQEEGYEPDVLKIALQQFTAYLPSLMH